MNETALRLGWKSLNWKLNYKMKYGNGKHHIILKDIQLRKNMIGKNYMKNIERDLAILDSTIFDLIDKMVESIAINVSKTPQDGCYANKNNGFYISSNIII